MGQFSRSTASHNRNNSTSTSTSNSLAASMDSHIPPVPQIPLMTGSGFVSSPTTAVPPAPIFMKPWESKIAALPENERERVHAAMDAVRDKLNAPSLRLAVETMVTSKAQDGLRLVPDLDSWQTQEVKASTERATPQALKMHLQTTALQPSVLSLQAASPLRSPLSPMGNAWAAGHYWSPQFSPSPLNHHLDSMSSCTTEVSTSPPSSPGPARLGSAYEQVLIEVRELASSLCEKDQEIKWWDAELQAATTIVEALSTEVDEFYGLPVPGEVMKAINDLAKEKEQVLTDSKVSCLEKDEIDLWLALSHDTCPPEFSTIIDRAREFHGKIRRKNEKRKRGTPAGITALAWATKICDDLVAKKTAAEQVDMAEDKGGNEKGNNMSSSDSEGEFFSKTTRDIIRKGRGFRRRSSRWNSKSQRQARDTSLGWPRKVVTFTKIEDTPDNESPFSVRSWERSSFRARRKQEERLCVSPTVNEEIPALPKLFVPPEMTDTASAISQAPRIAPISKTSSHNLSTRHRTTSKPLTPIPDISSPEISPSPSTSHHHKFTLGILEAGSSPDRLSQRAPARAPTATTSATTLLPEICTPQTPRCVSSSASASEGNLDLEVRKVKGRAPSILDLRDWAGELRKIGDSGEGSEEVGDVEGMNEW